MVLESTEQVISVLFSVWGKEEGLFKRGREGMLILTSKRIAFVSKTKMNMSWWRDEVERQLKAFVKSNNTIRVIEEYTPERLARDLQDESNMNIQMKQVAGLELANKHWGSELKLKFGQDNKVKTYTFAIVKGWTTYPVKDPIAFLDVDWQPWINAAKSYLM